MDDLLHLAPLLLIAWTASAVAVALVVGRAVRIAEARAVHPVRTRRSRRR
jgi:hypothetical protein